MSVVSDTELKKNNDPSCWKVVSEEKKLDLRKTLKSEINR